MDGTRFAANEGDIQVSFAGVVVADGITADAGGAWQATFNVPDVPFGDYKVDAAGAVTTAEVVQDVIFTVEPPPLPIPGSTRWGLVVLVGLALSLIVWKLRRVPAVG